MNDRILDIAVASNLISADYNGFDRTVLSGAERRFAEMLIQECIAKAEEEAERYLGFPNLKDADMYAKVMYNYQALLKEHFGVE